jgi:ribosome biogenesis protein BMS1
MSDVGGVRYDKDAVYINVPGIYSKDSENSGQRTEGESMLLELQDVENTHEEQMNMTGMRLFEGSAMLGADALDGEDDGDSNDGSDLEGEGSSDEELSDDEDDDEEEESGKEDAPRPDSRNRRAWPAGGSGSKASKGQSNLVFDDDEAEDEEEGDYDGMENGAGDFEGSDDEEEDEEDEENELLRWKDDIKGKAARAHASNRRVDYMALVYGNKDHAANQANDVSDSESDHDELLRKVEKPERAEARNVLVDSCRPNLPAEVLSKWNDDDVLDSLRYRFITGSTDGPAPENGDDDEILDGDFEDLENAAPGGNTSAGGDEADEGDDLLDKKEALKRKFDAMYDEEDEDGKGDESLYERTKAEMEKQAAINRAEFADADPSVRYQLEGFSPGTYVRIVLEDVPYEFSAHFSPKYPVLVGGLLPTEDTFGYVQVRLKKHRWHPKILKNHDPLIFSVGWRRFQTIPMFHIIENGQRHRMLKYTPEHMHCMATFYGPTAPPNTGFCAFKSLSGTQSSFRISATGTIVDIDQGVEVVKKLKLVGHPYKVFKNTAFIKDMFTSSLEVAKFEGASLRTVSGIRGQIKKHLSKPEGCFRATFEDKILMSGGF